MGDYTVKVEEGRVGDNGNPSAGAVYRCIYAKDGLMEILPSFESPWDFFSESVKRNPKNPMLGRRNRRWKGRSVCLAHIPGGHDTTLKIGSAIRSHGVNPGIYSPEWIIAFEAWCCLRVGANAVEYIINHAEVSTAFVQESKLPAICSLLHSYPDMSIQMYITSKNFGMISDKQKEAAEELGVACFSWAEFASVGNLDGDLPPKQKTNTCMIIYTSGTRGKPKGVTLNNGAFIAEVLSMDKLLLEINKQGSEEDVYFSFLPLAHIFDQIIETYCVYQGSSIGFWEGDIRYLIKDLLVLKPTIFCGVPRVYDRIYTGFEMLRAVHLEPIPFDIDHDLITPTFKLKRPQLLEYYKDCVDKLYGEAKGTKA